MKICVLWHMHQPDYRLPGEGGKCAMPWVRLHAAKDYMDMARLAEEAPASVRTTFNLTPCLLEQLRDLAEGRASDAFLDVARKDSKDLNEAERHYALRHFFSVHEERMLRPLPRYVELKEKLARARSRGKTLEAFTDDDFRDLAVLFHLAWSGQWLRRDERVSGLLAKGRQFSEEDKRSLLAAQDEQARAILPLYGELARAGKIEISTTPLYHPILPLLIDLRSAGEARQGCSTQGIEFRFPEDAHTHVAEGVARAERYLGFRPRGMWPSEGSLSEAALEVIQKAGIAWVATDEQNLRKSLLSELATRRDVHLRPWRVRGEGPAIFFRDTTLSDLIGFTYQRWEAGRAADDFVSRVVALPHDVDGHEAVVPVILDGENAWEGYVENGELFLRALYQRLGTTKGLEATTFSRALEASRPGVLSRLKPGSWIYGNFDTWAGHPEKNRAWQLLSAVRHEIEDGAELPADARECLLRAEGSDWFWWFGDDHPTAYLSEFDALFRQNLSYVVKRMGRAVPGLDRPVAPREHVRAAVEAPLALISPKIDGRADRYYEWIGSGVFRTADDGATMKLGSEPIATELRFGFDDAHLYLRLGTGKAESEGALALSTVTISVDGRRFSWTKGRGIHALDGLVAAEAACEKVLEVGLPRAALGLAPGKRVALVIELESPDGRRERLPREGAIDLHAPDEHFDMHNWTI